jgi:hypothetical protein
MKTNINERRGDNRERQGDRAILERNQRDPLASGKKPGGRDAKKSYHVVSAQQPKTIPAIGRRADERDIP